MVCGLRSEAALCGVLGANFMVGEVEFRGGGAIRGRTGLCGASGVQPGEAAVCGVLTSGGSSSLRDVGRRNQSG